MKSHNTSNRFFNTEIIYVEQVVRSRQESAEWKIISKPPPPSMVHFNNERHLLSLCYAHFILVVYNTSEYTFI